MFKEKKEAKIAGKQAEKSTEKKTPKSELTRQRIYQTAMRMFRKKGFDETTMREIATDAEMALGAAYYYFPSKEAIVLAYYEEMQTEHEKRYAAWIENEGRKANLRSRLGFIFHSKLDILENDRKLMGALLRYAGTPDHPLSFFGPGTKDIRLRSIAILDEALKDEELPADMATLVPLALWSLQMGTLLFLLHDNSAAQKKTRRLINLALDQTIRLLAVIRFPLMKPVRTHITGMLRELELIEA